MTAYIYDDRDKLIQLTCTKHRRYEGVRAPWGPRSAHASCLTCLGIYYLRHAWKHPFGRESLVILAD